MSVEPLSPGLYQLPSIFLLAIDCTHNQKTLDEVQDS